MNKFCCWLGANEIETKTNSLVVTKVISSYFFLSCHGYKHGFKGYNDLYLLRLKIYKFFFFFFISKLAQQSVCKQGKCLPTPSLAPRVRIHSEEIGSPQRCHTVSIIRASRRHVFFYQQIGAAECLQAGKVPPYTKPWAPGSNSLRRD